MLTKHHFVVLTLGMGLSGMWRTDLFVLLCPSVIAKLQTNKHLKQLVQDITNQLLKYSSDCSYSDFLQTDLHIDFLMSNFISCTIIWH